MVLGCILHYPILSHTHISLQNVNKLLNDYILDHQQKHKQNHMASVNVHIYLDSSRMQQVHLNYIIFKSILSKSSQSQWPTPILLSCPFSWPPITLWPVNITQTLQVHISTNQIPAFTYLTFHLCWLFIGYWTMWLFNHSSKI